MTRTELLELRDEVREAINSTFEAQECHYSHHVLTQVVADDLGLDWTILLTKSPETMFSRRRLRDRLLRYVDTAAPETFTRWAVTAGAILRGRRRQPIVGPTCRNPGVPQHSVRGLPRLHMHGDYQRFHGVEPDSVMEGKTWVPGPLVYIGRGVDVGYNIIDRRSNKDGWYVHDFGHGVSVYRRAKDGERPTKVLSSFPHELLILGSNLGFTYEDDRGVKHEVKGSLRKKLCATPDKRKLVIVGPSGVEFVAWGGKMRVVDWIYD